MTNAEKITAIERALADHGIYNQSAHDDDLITHALADLRAWQEIAERHSRDDYLTRPACSSCGDPHFPCADRKLADDAIDRMHELWGKP